MIRWRGQSRLKPKQVQSGYTITEVMIVLAVTTALFAMIVVAFNGQQGRAEFTQAVRNFEAKLQNVAVESSASTYQTANCTAAPTTGTPSFGATPSNGTCTFLGKVFMPSPTARNSEIYTLVGRRTIGDPPVDVTSVEQAQGVVAPNPESYNHTYQLEVLKMVDGADSDIIVYGLGFTNPIGGVGRSDPASGVRLYGLTISAFVAGTVGNDFVPLPGGAIICLRGQNGQRAEMRVGTESNQSQIITELDTTNEGACRVD